MKRTTFSSANSTATERYGLFRLVHADHPKCWLDHYVVTPVTIAEIEQRLGPKNHVTHVWVEKQWKRVT